MAQSSDSLCVDTGVLERAIHGGREGEGGNKETHMNNVTTRPLTKRQIALVDAFVANGGNLTKAAEEAGYAEGNSGRVSAYKAMKTAHVKQYLMQATAEVFSTHAAMAVGKVANLANKAKSEYVQLQAAQDLLDRAGFKPIDRSQVQVAGDIKVSIDLG